MANWCVSEFTESLQARKLFAGHAVIGAITMLAVAQRVRAGKPLPLAAFAGIVAFNVGCFALIGVYNRRIKRFWEETGFQWRASANTCHSSDPRV